MSNRGKDGAKDSTHGAHSILEAALARFLGASIPLLVIGFVFVQAAAKPGLGPAFALLGWVFIGLAALMLVLAIPYMLTVALFLVIRKVVTWYNVD